MNVKNLNPLERHVEKIALAVAVAGALYIGYLASQPIYVPDTDITAGAVESKVTDALKDLQTVRDETAKRKDLSSTMMDYVKAYQDVMMRQPLNPELTSAAAVPPFAPLQVPIGASGSSSSDVSGPMEVVTPTVPPPKNVTAVPSLATVLVTAPGNGAPAVPVLPGIPSGAPTKDMNWVTISGDIPMGQFIAEMNDPALQANQKLSTTVQHAAVYQIEVQRHSRTNGGWSAWESIPAPNQDIFKVDWPKVTDADLPGVVTTLENGLSQIAEPPLYTLANGQPVVPPILQKPMETPPPPKAVAPVSSRNPSAPPADVAPPAAAPAGPALVLPDPTTLRAQANIPFWLYDEHVTQGSEYQYQVRLVMFNPTYRYPLGLKDPAMKDQPTLASTWYTVPGTVNVSSDIYFFVNNNMGNGAGTGNVLVGFRVYKWTNGRWYPTEWNAQAGVPLSGKVRLGDNKMIDAQTGYMLVDALPSPSGNEMKAILLSPAGELVTRSSVVDSPDTNAKRKELEEAVKAAAPPPPPPPLPSTPKPRPNPSSPSSSSGNSVAPSTGGMAPAEGGR